MTDKAANRKKQQALRARMAEKGFRQIAVYVHDEDRERLRRYAERLKRQRLS